MPPSQLRRLKESLRKEGITGPQKSKKEKKQGLSTEQKIRRHAALHSIRESFNPFEVKHLSRPVKRDITTPQTLKGAGSKAVLGKPGVTKSLGEQRRRETLLLEVQKRHKVGGIVDRRIGEDDPTLTAEEQAIQRFAKERSRKKGASVFDLEEGDDDEGDLLTHGGKAIDLMADDYDAANVGNASDDDVDNDTKRKRLAADVDNDVLDNNDDEDEPSRKKSKKEVMEEVIKKSKLHKYERQKAQEDDDEIRRALDQDFSAIQGALGAFRHAIEKGQKLKVPEENKVEEPTMHPDRAAILEGTATKVSDNLYDEHLRKVARDGRARPSDRIKTDEEKAREEAELKEELEEARRKRMASEIEEDNEDQSEIEEQDEYDLEAADDAAEFGFSNINHSNFKHTRPEGVDDEDDFLIEEDFIASGSETGLDKTEVFSEESESEDELLTREDGQKEQKGSDIVNCPTDLGSLKATLHGIPYERYHDTIREIRIQHDVSLDPENKEKLATFSSSLVAYLAELPLQNPQPSTSVTDVIIRHIHSMARKSPDPVCQAFREQLQRMHQARSMTTGDLIILTAIGTIFPTSDHFHKIVTPAMLLMASWLSKTAPETPKDLTTGAYLVALCLKYLSPTNRYMPELLRFTTIALQSPNPRRLLDAHITNLTSMATLWSTKSAFPEIFPSTLITTLKSLKAPKAATHLSLLRSQATLARRPLQLHHHRPLAIKTFVPRFEEDFDPRKHYDPDPDRAESIRLRKEYKKERKGVLREVRKDANFLAREKLREKKLKDVAYEQKFKKLVAEIQGEEGKERNAYEKEKRLRRGKR
jgi:nucleolar protein 14